MSLKTELSRSAGAVFGFGRDFRFAFAGVSVVGVRGFQWPYRAFLVAGPHHTSSQMSESVYTVKLPAPREVTPLIRTARWGLLAVGILYGAIRLKFLKSREVNIQKRNKIILEKRAKEYKEWFAEQAEKSAQQLAREAGVLQKP
nr:unnamed protein product [Fasciola hepatica]